MLNHKSRPVAIDTLRQFMKELLVAVGFDAETADKVAEIHLESDLRGISVQGFNHLIYSHLQYYLEDKADPKGKPSIVKEGSSYALIDGHSGPGPIAALAACDVASTKAKESGCAVVGVTNSHDLFQAGLYAERIARNDLVALLFSDDVIPVVHPLGGTQPLIGSNPLAWAVPTESDPFLLDFTPCMTLPTYVRYARMYDAPLPDNVACDADGHPTTDPFQVCTGIDHRLDIGAINPGGNKGYGMLLMIDFLSGALVGSDMGLDHINKDSPNKGHLFVAMDPNMFGNSDGFKRAVTRRMNDIRNSKKAVGVDEIRMPGEGSFQRRRQSLERGTVEIDELCWADALTLAEKLGLESIRQ